MMAIQQEGDLPTTSRHSVTAFSSIVAKLSDTKNYHSTSSSCTMANVRDEILQLGAIVGQLCTVFLTDQFHYCNQEKQRNDCAVAVKKEQRKAITSMVSQRPFWENNENHSEQSSSEQTNAAHFKLGQVFIQVFVIAKVCGIDLPTSILKKIELNGRKYPVELCKVRLLTTMGGEYLLSCLELITSHH